MKIRFDRFTLDSATRQLLEGDRESHLSPKAFDALHLLIDRRPAVVTKAELQERIWPGTFVVDANLNVLVAEIRRVLHDDPSSPRFVRTVHRVGYAFCGDATAGGPPQGHEAGTPSRVWVTWNDRTIHLSPGENIVGRDPRCAVWLDASGVSRRHARIVVTETSASIEDLGSKNGTFVGDTQVTGVRKLNDTDVIKVGSTELKFRMWSDAGAPPTERLPRTRGRAAKTPF